MQTNISYSNLTLELCSRKRLFKNKRYLKLLKKLALEYRMPNNLLVGIYLIETNFRPKYIRCAEYFMTINGIIWNKVANKPFKNYTIGRCQLGIAYILKYYDKYTYKHVRRIYSIDGRDIINILKSIYYKENFKICAEMVNEFYHRAIRTTNDYNLQLRNIGQAFNGKYSYGLLLEEVVSLLDSSNCYNTYYQD